MGVGPMSLSPDGKRVAFNASVVHEPVQSYTQPDLWVMDVSPNAKPKNLTAGFDFDIGAGLTGDQGAPRAGGGNPPIWTADGRSIIERFTREGRANLGVFDAENGRLTELTKGEQAVMNFRATTDRSKLIYTISTPTQINDLYIADRNGGNAKQLTHVNDAILSKLNLTEPE